MWCFLVRTKKLKPFVEKSCSFAVVQFLLINCKSFTASCRIAVKTAILQNILPYPAVLQYLLAFRPYSPKKKLQFCSIAVFTDKLQNLYRTLTNCRKNGNTTQHPAVSCRFAVIMGLHTHQNKVTVLQFCSFY